jgi:uncharacterized protein
MKSPARENVAEQCDLHAGDFSSWLCSTRSALITEGGARVDCGDCTACCSSSLFIHIRPEETQTLARIRREMLFTAPGLPKGNVLLGYDEKGLCPMLINGKCSIYEHRPITCRNYDCRVFAAAGITADGTDETKIVQRANHWRFTYPTKRDHDERLAVQATARFIQEHAESFPGGRIPRKPSELAILAIKAYEVFLRKERTSDMAGNASPNTEIADAIVEACRNFDAKRSR